MGIINGRASTMGDMRRVCGEGHQTQVLTLVSLMTKYYY